MTNTNNNNINNNNINLLELRSGSDSTLSNTTNAKTIIAYRTISLEDKALRKSLELLDSTNISTNLNDNWHKCSTTQLLLCLKTFKHGLDDSEALLRLLNNGPNIIKTRSKNQFFKIIRYFFGGFCWILWIATIFLFLSWKPFGDPPSITNLATALLLFLVIIIQAGFSAYQDYSSSKIMNSIQSMLPELTIVIRQGAEKIIPSSELVVGDVIKVKYGSKIGADIRFFKVNGLKMDNSVLTGETESLTATTLPCDKDLSESRNIGFLGTLVTEGEGLGIVYATGSDTMMGRIANLTLNTCAKPTILQNEITHAMKYIAIAALISGTICVIFWLTWLKNNHPGFLSISHVLSTNLGGVIVAFVPNGLPVAITLILSVIAKRMFDQKILVKNLNTVETLGSVNVLCSDKTGTLTANQMVVINVASFDFEMELGKPTNLSNNSVLKILSYICLYNNDSAFVHDDHSPILVRKINGNATDAALLRYAHLSLDVNSGENSYHRKISVPFNSKTKIMITIVKLTNEYPNIFSAQENQSTLLVKGAPDYLFSKCSTFLTVDENNAPIIKALSENDLKKFYEIRNRWSESGNRVILLAYKNISDNNQIFEISNELIHESIDDMTIAGFVGIFDPPRPESADVVKQCQDAGIRTFMVTGDFPSTASSIAKNVGIFTNDKIHTFENIDSNTFQPESSLLLSGDILDDIKPHQWDKITRYKEIVFARTSPEQKLEIVSAFQKRGCIVAVTGDGVNDAPALKNADIGIAMGSGSDVAVEAASMVLLDSDFSSIIIALKQGRNVYENLKKVILYLLPAGSFCELIPVFVNMFLGVPLPLSGFLMIFICMVTDMTPSLSLMYEPPENDLLKRPPRNPACDPLVDWKLLGHAYLFVGLIECVFSHLLFFIYLKNEWGIEASQLIFAYEKWGQRDGYCNLSISQQNQAIRGGQCVYFVTIVIMQFGNLLSVRTRKLSIFHHTPLQNLYLFKAMLVSICAALIVVYVPFFQETFLTYPIPVIYWIIPIPLAILLLVLDEVRKLFVRMYPQGRLAKIAW